MPNTTHECHFRDIAYIRAPVSYSHSVGDIVKSAMMLSISD